MCNLKFIRKTPIVTCILSFCVILTEIHCMDDDSTFCTVNTTSGKVRGKQNQTLFDKIPYYSFRGIPYAKAPIGNLRFKV